VLTVAGMDRRALTEGHRGRGVRVDVDVDRDEIRNLEIYRQELALHCSRVLGSWSEADDAAQETLVRAWRGLDRFEGRASLRSWLHRIAINVCLDMRRRKQRRARPMDPTSWPAPAGSVRAGERDVAWLEPVPVGHARSPCNDPAELVVSGEAVRRAFLIAMHQLPARQRSVLILRDVLRWKATEVAELLGTSVASVNSTLQRARSRIAGLDPNGDGSGRMDGEPPGLLRRHVEAFERRDLDALVSLLR
jgi:RNA polymerase sigma-70 factor, ECF subfamily